MTTKTFDVCLQGCSPSPLAHYLKALGILRLVGEQVDSDALGWWKHDRFWLRSTLSDDELLTFFLHNFSPTPLVVPWSGADFFDSSYFPNASNFEKKWPVSSAKNRPKGASVIEAVLASHSDRLSSYRHAIRLVQVAMHRAGVQEKDDLDPKKGRLKARFVTELRNVASDGLLKWIDANSTVKDISKGSIALNNLFGGGGGSDGNAHFSDNFMQCVWLTLPDFDWQRKAPILAAGGMNFVSRNALERSLFGSKLLGCEIRDLSPALFDSGSVGGANATAGFIADAASNPWDYILMLEGALLFSGAASRRYAHSGSSSNSFPFSVEVVSAGSPTLISTEAAAQNREFWLPLWRNPACRSEISYVFSESRISVGAKAARTGLDVVRAISSYGVDRGIDTFQRIAMLKGRIGGDNYFTACDAGRFVVRANPGHEELLAPISNWLDRFRIAATGKNAPARSGRALRRLEAAIMKLCQRGEPADVQATLVALGDAEAGVAISKHMRVGNMGSGINPLPLLDSQWLLKAYDGSCEFRLAASLASIDHTSLGPIRRHIEPFDWKSRYPKWLENVDDPGIVWRGGSLTNNLCRVLNRRLIEAQTESPDDRQQTRFAPLRGSLCASLSDITAFIRGSVDDDKIDMLFKSLCLLNFPRFSKSNSAFSNHLVELARLESVNRNEAQLIELLRNYLPFDSHDHSLFKNAMQHLHIAQSPLPLPDASYGLLKLCYLPHKLVETAIPIKPQIIRRALAGDAAEATHLAARRLIASGFKPAMEQSYCSPYQIQRTAAAIVFPIHKTVAKTLAGRILIPRENSELEEEPFKESSFHSV